MSSIIDLKKKMIGISDKIQQLLVENQILGRY